MSIIETIWPSVSIIVPIFNGERTIAKCLAAIEQQDYLGEWETIIVDNKSADGTRALLDCARFVRIVTCPRPGPAAARNDGLSASLFDLVAFTDADCIPESNWLRELVAHLTPELVGVGGVLKSASNGLIQAVVTNLSFDQL
jgi:glycosyltransferase involved in cell wall biosynthesis